MPIEIKLVLDKTEAEKEVQEFARDVKVLIDQNRKLELETNVDDLTLDLFKLRQELSKVKKEGKDGVLDEKRFKELNSEITRVSSNLTESRRRLNNLKNTGDETTSRLKKRFEEVNGSIGRFSGALKNAFVGALSAAGIIGAVRAVTGAFKDASAAALEFESAFIGVQKTIEASPKEFRELRKELIDLSTELSGTFEDIAKIAELGGQLGVGIEDIETFVDTVSRIGVASDLSVEEASTAFARISNILGEPLENVDQLGGAIINLGNNIAATESEITNFVLRIAAAGKNAGFARDELVAIAGSFASVGVQAELGGTVVQKTFGALTDAVITGGEELDKFAEIAGTSASDFAELWRDNASEAFTRFIEGLGEQGENARSTLTNLGLSGERTQFALNSLAGAGDTLRSSLSLVADETANVNALIEESQKRLESDAERRQNAIDSYRASLARIGNVLNTILIPALEAGARAFQFIVDNGALFGGILGAITVAVGVLAAPLSGIALTLAGIVAIFTGGGSLGLLLSAFGGTEDDVSAKTANLKDNLDDLTGSLENLKDQLLDNQEEQKKLTQQFQRGLISVEDYKAGMEELGAVNEELTGKIEETTGETEKATDAYNKNQDKIKDLNDEMDSLNVAQNKLVRSGKNNIETQREYEQELQRLRKELRIAQGVTEGYTDAQGNLVEINRDNILTQQQIQDNLNGLSAANTVEQFDRIRASQVSLIQTSIQTQKALLQILESQQAVTQSRRASLDTLTGADRDIFSRSTLSFDFADSLNTQNISRLRSQLADAEESLVSLNNTTFDTRESLSGITDGINNQKIEESGDTINKLQTRTKELKDQLEDATIGSDKFNSIQAELTDTQSKLNNSLGNTSGGAKALKTDISELGDETEDTEEKVKDAQEVFSELLDSLTRGFDEGLDGLVNYKDELSEISDEFDDLKKSGEDALKSISEELQEIDESEGNSLAQNRIKLLEEQKGIIEEIAELESKQDTEDASETIDEDILAKQEELALVKSEIALIEENVNSELLEQVENYEKLSDTQKTLLDNEKRRAELLELQSVNQAIADEREIRTRETDDGVITEIQNEEGEFVELQNLKAIELARETITRRQELDTRIEDIQIAVQEEKRIYEQLTQDRIDQEKKLTDAQKVEINERIKAVRRYAEEARRAQEIASSLGLSSSASSSSESGSGTTNNDVTNNYDITVNPSTAAAGAEVIDSITNLPNQG